MQIKINNQHHQLREPFPASLQEALDLLVPDLKPKGVAVALNQRVVPRPLWAQTEISDQAELLIITATQGG
ncbi:sulfur carrier protein ThiS [Sphingobacterium paludis]|jgi:sulfur carrier protein|uniref:Sulfur carrier protein n=1 Tax=Sphingobacterium paludis TaxID=1476465 RepID=A0A4R7CV98_9SPHI|nr:sulfur carrier protein ThiS [Sphingobacterium paludis]TDS11777.1 sulfur carrier protein [Sphingobacterium paludis]